MKVGWIEKGDTVTAQLTWLAEGRVLEGILRQMGQTEADEINNITSHYFTQMRGRQIHTVLDISRLHSKHIDMTLLTTLLLPMLVDPQCGWMILYGSDKPAHELFDMSLSRLSRYRLRTAPDRNAALALLSEKVPSLKLSA